MPLDFGIPDLLTSETQRFAEALGDLSDGGVRRAAAAAARRRPDVVTPRAVSIPGWDDFVHIVPHPTVTPEMRAAHYAATRRGQPSPLNPDLVDELERRRTRARRIQSSASPPWARAYGQALTAVDNVQDLLTTVVTLGRLTLNPVIRVLDQIGPALSETALRESAERRVFLELAGRKAAGELVTTGVVAELRGLARAAVSREFAAGAFGFGARTVGRLLGPLGWILLAADLMKLLTLVGLWASPFYGVWCTRSTAGLGGLLPAMLFGSKLCARLTTYNRSNPFGYRARLIRSRTLRSWKPSIYNMLEVAQTTDSLFGVGLSFGWLSGTVTDLGFALEGRARGLPFTIDPTPFAESVHRLLAPGMRSIPTAALPAHRAAAGVLAGSLALHGTQETWTVEEHVEALAATSVALDLLRPLLESPAMVEAVNLALEGDLSPPSYGVDRVRGELLDGGDEAGGFGRWPLEGAPATMRGDAITRIGPPLFHQALKDLIAPRRDDPSGVVLGALAKRIIDRTCLLMTGHPDAFEFEPVPEYQILESITMENRIVNVSSGEDAIAGYFHALAMWKDVHGARSVPLEILERCARRWHVELIRLGPPETSLPLDRFTAVPHVQNT
jgi:hypothetical protein